MIEFQKNNASLSFSEALLKGDKGDPGITPHIGEMVTGTSAAKTPGNRLAAKRAIKVTCPLKVLTTGRRQIRQK